MWVGRRREEARSSDLPQAHTWVGTGSCRCLESRHRWRMNSWQPHWLRSPHWQPFTGPSRIPYPIPFLQLDVANHYQSLKSYTLPLAALAAYPKKPKKSFNKEHKAWVIVFSHCVFPSHIYIHLVLSKGHGYCSFYRDGLLVPPCDPWPRFIFHSSLTSHPYCYSLYWTFLLMFGIAVIKKTVSAFLFSRNHCPLSALLNDAPLLFHPRFHISHLLLCLWQSALPQHMT